MDYNAFISSIEILKSNTIRTISFPESCAMTQIPNEFRYLLPDVLEIIDNNKEKLCCENEVIAIFGMQVSVAAIMSDIPEITDRISNDKNPECHFCCNLNYLTTNNKRLKNITSWDNAQTIVIDFTAGAVMDSTEYLNRLFNKAETMGTTYGYLNPMLLHEIWQAITKSKSRIQNK